MTATMRIRPRTWLWLGVLSACALYLAACAGEPAGESTAAPGTADRAASAPPGPDLPDPLAFTAATLDGQALDTEALRGQALALWFWAPW